MRLRGYKHCLHADEWEFRLEERTLTAVARRVPTVPLARVVERQTKAQ